MAHPRRRNWTLRDLDRSQVYILRFNDAAQRWDLYDVLEQKPIVTVAQPSPGPLPAL